MLKPTFFFLENISFINETGHISNGGIKKST